MTCIGNHERDFPDSGSFYKGHDSGGECGTSLQKNFPHEIREGVPYDHRLIMPHTNAVRKNDVTWYGFDWGNIHFTLMSTEHDFQPGSEQHKWIVSELESVDRSKTPWVSFHRVFGVFLIDEFFSLQLVFAGHRPMYIDSTNNDTNGGDQPVAVLLRSSLESLLVKYKVDLALWGHHHSYQRTCPVYESKCRSKGEFTTFFVDFIFRNFYFGISLKFLQNILYMS
jgi:hypothetical protein